MRRWFSSSSCRKQRSSLTPSCRHTSATANVPELLGVSTRVPSKEASFARLQEGCGLLLVALKTRLCASIVRGLGRLRGCGNCHAGDKHRTGGERTDPTKLNHYVVLFLNCAPPRPLLVFAFRLLLGGQFAYVPGHRCHFGRQELVFERLHVLPLSFGQHLHD